MTITVDDSGLNSLAESIRHTGNASNGGIDGEIYQDTLGLDKIFIQAKRHLQNHSTTFSLWIPKTLGSYRIRFCPQAQFLFFSFFLKHFKFSL